MRPNQLTRREALTLFARATAAVTTGGMIRAARAQSKPARAGRKEFDVRDFDAVGDGATLDTRAIQRAIDAAAAAGGRVILPGGRSYLVGTLELKSGIEFHLADDAVLRASTRPEDYAGGAAVVAAVQAARSRVAGVEPPPAERAATILTARDAQALVLSGTGRIDGRAREFMERYDEADEWWRPGPFRPNLAVLIGCRDLEVRDLTFHQAPIRTLHLVGCERVLVDGVKIRNQLDAPNCDGIDPDHSRDVEIRNCDIVCGDDAIVVKASRAFVEHGETANIHVHDCTIETQDSGLKVGTETTRPIHHVRFERCTIRSSCRGLNIQLRDEADVHDIVFRDIVFKARYHSDPWWGRGEAISFTALPRTEGAKLGKIHGVRVENVTGRAENSVRISGCRESRIDDVTFDNVAVTLDRETKYRGGVWDNRPTKSAYPALEEHGTPGIHVRFADRIALRRCRVAWGANRPEYFTHALEAHDVTELSHPDFAGEAAHPERDAAIAVR
ncbi:MAG TPA: glycosyl hydrolase family 28 protein [Opitutaceae bacterium]|nr:glycosyl hydrolase family 28 protein [Opitutaceae bacterium]